MLTDGFIDTPVVCVQLIFGVAVKGILVCYICKRPMPFNNLPHQFDLISGLGQSVDHERTRLFATLIFTDVYD